jgi:hypothetical protein
MADREVDTGRLREFVPRQRHPAWVDDNGNWPETPTRPELAQRVDATPQPQQNGR